MNYYFTPTEKDLRTVSVDEPLDQLYIYVQREKLMNLIANISASADDVDFKEDFIEIGFAGKMSK